MLLLSFFGIVLLFLFTHLIERRLPYRRAYNIFEVCHFLAGFFIAAGAAAIFSRAVAVIEVTLAIGVIWEVWKFMLERPFLSRLSCTIGWRRGHWTLADTLLDLLLDAAGAVVFLALSY